MTNTYTYYMKVSIKVVGNRCSVVPAITGSLTSASSIPLTSRKQQVSSK